MKISQFFRNPATFCIIFLLLTPVLSSAATFMVTEGQSIADALAMSAAGDSVLIASGQYRQSGLEMPSGVTLAALGDGEPPQLIGDDASTILHCDNLSIATRIDGLVFVGDFSGSERFPRRGHGIRVINSPIIISDCSFLGLRATYGGAIFIGAGLAPSIVGCHFESNTAEASGAAISLVGGQGLILDYCFFIENLANAGGSVLNAALQASATITHCTMVANGNAGMGDIQVWDSDQIDVSQCIMASSQGRPWYGDHAGAPSYHCSDLAGNAGGDWVGALAGQAGNSGNISQDPMFCGPQIDTDPYTVNEDSPCNADCGLMGAFEIGCDSSSGTDSSEMISFDENVLPAVTKLRGNFPNPFNPQTTIAFDLSQSGHAAVDIYDLAGRLVRNLHSGVLAAGPHQVMWNGRGPDGRMAAAGIYFFRLKTEQIIDTQRMTLVK